MSIFTLRSVIATLCLLAAAPSYAQAPQVSIDPQAIEGISPQFYNLDHMSERYNNLIPGVETSLSRLWSDLIEPAFLDSAELKELAAELTQNWTDPTLKSSFSLKEGWSDRLLSRTLSASEKASLTFVYALSLVERERMEETPSVGLKALDESLVKSPHLLSWALKLDPGFRFQGEEIAVGFLHMLDSGELSFDQLYDEVISPRLWSDWKNEQDLIDELRRLSGAQVSVTDLLLSDERRLNFWIRLAHRAADENTPIVQEWTPQDLDELRSRLTPFEAAIGPQEAQLIREGSWAYQLSQDVERRKEEDDEKLFLWLKSLGWGSGAVAAGALAVRAKNWHTPGPRHWITQRETFVKSLISEGRGKVDRAEALRLITEPQRPSPSLVPRDFRNVLAAARAQELARQNLETRYSKVFGPQALQYIQSNGSLFNLADPRLQASSLPTFSQGFERVERSSSLNSRRSDQLCQSGLRAVGRLKDHRLNREERIARTQQLRSTHREMRTTGLQSILAQSHQGNFRREPIQKLINTVHTRARMVKASTWNMPMTREWPLLGLKPHQSLVVRQSAVAMQGWGRRLAARAARTGLWLGATAAASLAALNGLDAVQDSKPEDSLQLGQPQDDQTAQVNLRSREAAVMSLRNELNYLVSSSESGLSWNQRRILDGKEPLQFVVSAAGLGESDPRTGLVRHAYVVLKRESLEAGLLLRFELQTEGPVEALKWKWIFDDAVLIAPSVDAGRRLFDDEINPDVARQFMNERVSAF
jgi:hypothetical protein